MQPHEIRPDTALCTIMGYNAQTGPVRRYFNRILRHYDKNATAIALNINDEHFDFVMRNLSQSKVSRMILEQEFRHVIGRYCDDLNALAAREGRVDYVEVLEGRIIGYCLDEAIDALYESPGLLDDRMRLVTRMMLIAHRWYDTPLQIDQVPIWCMDT
jgi:hypothetical protein